jgi:hypothetical protein
MTYSAKKDSRHITLRPAAITIYDRWKEEGSAIINTSQAIIEKATKEESQQPFTEEQIKELMQMEDRILHKILKELERK